MEPHPKNFALGHPDDPWGYRISRTPNRDVGTGITDPALLMVIGVVSSLVSLESPKGHFLSN